MLLVGRAFAFDTEIHEAVGLIAHVFMNWSLTRIPVWVVPLVYVPAVLAAFLVAAGELGLWTLPWLVVGYVVNIGFQIGLSQSLRANDRAAAILDLDRDQFTNSQGILDGCTPFRRNQ